MDLEIFRQFRRLLKETPDPLDLPKRGRRYTRGGDWSRRSQIKRDLEAAFVGHRATESRQDISCVVSVRRG